VRGREVFSVRRNHFAPAGAADDDLELDLVAFSGEILGRESRDRKYLLAWANSEAQGHSFREICREFGWPRTTAERGRDHGADILALELRSRGIHFVEDLPRLNIRSRRIA